MKQGVLIVLLCLVVCVGCADRNATSEKDQAEMHFLLGQSHLREGSYTQALRELLQAAEFNDESAKIQAALAQTYQLKKAFFEAEEHYLKALKLSDNDPDYQSNLASLYLDMKKWDLAIRFFKSATENLTFTHSTLAYTGMGYAYLQKGNYLEAVSTLKQALSFQADFPQARLYLAETYYQLEKADLAISELQSLLELYPSYTLAHYQLALAHMKKQNRQEAVAQFSEVIRLAPESDAGLRARDYLKLLE